MLLLRLLTIATVTFRHGLDEIVARFLLSHWLARLWLKLTFWRPLRKPRGVRMREAFVALGPLFIKFGQILSTRRDLFPADISDELSELQDRVPEQPFELIEEVISKSYGKPCAEVFAHIDRESIGSASVAQVHRAVLHDGQEAAVKVLRPDIARKVEQDLVMMKLWARLLEFWVPRARMLRPREIVKEFSRCLHEEIDLEHEAANCAQLGRNFAGHEMMRTPHIHWRLCTREVMVMQLLEGVPVDRIDELREAGIDLGKLARVGIEIFFTQVFRDSFFHADMHPGNLHVDAQGRFVVLDYGIMGTLSEFDKEYIGANFLAFFNRDYRKVAEMHVEAGWTPPDTPITQFESAIRGVCEPVFSLPLKDISFGRLLLQLFRVARRFNLIVQPQLLLLQKTLLSIEGMGRQLAPDLNLWEIAKPYLEDWARAQSSPGRLLAGLRDGYPAIVKLLPELPQAARFALTELRRRAAEDSGRDRALRRKLAAARLLAAALAGAVAVLLLLQ